MAVTARPTPEDGDLVVREHSRDGERVYSLHTAFGADQYLLRSRGEAVAQATVFAKGHRVRVRFSNGDSDLALIENFRFVP